MIRSTFTLHKDVFATMNKTRFIFQLYRIIGSVVYTRAKYSV